MIRSLFRVLGVFALMSHLIVVKGQYANCIKVDYVLDSIKISSTTWYSPLLIDSPHEIVKSYMANTPVYCIDEQNKQLYLYNPPISILKISILNKEITRMYDLDYRSHDRFHELFLWKNKLVFYSSRRCHIYDLDLNLCKRLFYTIYSNNHDLVDQVGRFGYELNDSSIVINARLFSGENKKFVFYLKDL